MTVATAARGYRPGEWFGIFGEHAVVLLPPSEKARVGTLWALVDDGAGFDVVLDALISEGLRDLPGFVLVSTVEGETKVVIRGEARAWFTAGNDTVEVAGTDLTTWVERSFSDVSATRLVVGTEGERSGGAPLPINNGLVRVGEVVEPSGAGATSEPQPIPVPVPEAEPEVAPTVAPDPETEPWQDVAPPGPIGPEPGLPAAPAPPSPFGVPSGPPPPIEHDGDTRSGSVVAEAADDEAPAVDSRPVARLVFSSGHAVEVDRAVLVGRAPEARRFTSGDQPRLVTVPSPAQEISSTHLEIRPGSGADHGCAVVTDLGSTNGTILVQPGLPPEELQAGVAVQLVPGAIIDLGDGVTIQVINP